MIEGSRNTALSLACQAMATRFEIVLHGGDAVALRAAGEEALNEIQRLEAQLSRYRPDSEIAHLNARAAREPVRVSPELFTLLHRARQLSEATAGAFDITVAPLVRCWGFMGGSGKTPEPEALEEARRKVGMHLVQFHAADFTVQFARDGVMLDLGAIGKGYAIEKAAGILREAGVTSALIHGGTSTVQALGHPPDAVAWNVAIANPQSSEHRDLIQREDETASKPAAPGVGVPPAPLTVSLCDEALSVSAVWGKYFESQGKTFGHVLDPHTGQPVSGAVLAAVGLPSATETDALSTALLVGGNAAVEKLLRLRPRIRTLLVTEAENGFVSDAHGIGEDNPGSRQD